MGEQPDRPMTGPDSKEQGETAGNLSDNVIFIRELMPRSGTNFLIDSLSNHEQTLRCPGSFWEFAPFRHQKEMVKWLNRMEAGQHTPLFRTDDFLPYIGDAWLRYLAGNEADRVLLFKEPSVTGIETMFKMFPYAKTVFVVRDGRDVVASLLKASFGLPRFKLFNHKHWRRLLPGEEFRIICRQTAQAAIELSRFVQSEMGRALVAQWKIVRYEDLLQHPKETMRELLVWANLCEDRFDWVGMANMPVRGSSFLRNDDGSMNFGRGIDRPDGFNAIGRWQNWSKRQCADYEKIVGPLMARFGYGD